jgi:Spy/CpxP family protein refolding chaperone
MKRLSVLGAAVIGVSLGIAPFMSAAQTRQPYAGLQVRPLKALSDEEIAELKAGRGMGLALVAELNGYPGPVHVLEHADALQLSAAQRAKVQQLFETMKAEAVPLGAKRIAQEADLDRQFASRTVTEASLVAATQAIGTTQAALRAAHLKYHLAMVEVLTPAQIARYLELRGYSNRAHGGDHRHGHRH